MRWISWFCLAREPSVLVFLLVCNMVADVISGEFGRLEKAFLFFLRERAQDSGSMMGAEGVFEVV